jgi:hypothetical protein
MCGRSPRCRAGRSPASEAGHPPGCPSLVSTFHLGSEPTEVDLANLPPDPGEPRPGFVFCRWAIGCALFKRSEASVFTPLPTEIGEATPRVHGPITATAPGRPVRSLGQGTHELAPDGALRAAPSRSPSPTADPRRTRPPREAGRMRSRTSEHSSVSTWGARTREDVWNDHRARRRVASAPGLSGRGRRRTQVVSPRSLEGRGTISRAA